MIIETVEAIFEGGGFRLLHPSHMSLRDGQRVRLVIEQEETPDTILELAAQVYAGLTAQARQEVEQVALERRDFFGDRT